MGLRRRRVFTFVAASLVAAATLLTSACTGTSPAPSSSPHQAGGSLPLTVQKQLSDAVTNAVTLSGASGAIVGVWAPWSGSWTTALGTTRQHGGDPMSVGMHFRIGDITRSMTCTVLLELVDDGTVKLDDRASTYLPDLPGIEGITLRQLCQNTAGLGDYTATLKPQFVNNPTREWPQLELISDGLAEPRVGKPGQTFADSSAGYVLLGLALQRATDESWSSLYQKYVFSRLGMTQSSYPESNPMSFPAPHPSGYATALSEDGVPQCGTTVDSTALSASMAWTEGGVISTLDDLKQYAQALATGALVSRASSKAQWTTMSPGGEAPAWRRYGLGVETVGPLRGNAGAITGFITSALSDPKSGLTVVVMLNNSTSGASFAETLGRQLAAIASKARGTKKDAPAIPLPWSEQQAAEHLSAVTVCPPPPPTATPAPAAP